MADNRSCKFNMNPHAREPICINTSRIYDSCCDKDCLSDLRVYFPGTCQHIIDNSTNVKCRKAEIITCCVEVEPIQFNKGCYNVDISYFFKLSFDMYNSLCGEAETVKGLCTFTKKCVLYGGEGSVKVFYSDYYDDEIEPMYYGSSNNPRAKVKVVDPVVLSAEICEEKECCCDFCNTIPTKVARHFDGPLEFHHNDKFVKVTLGLFSIVQLERDAQILIPSAEYCIPKKECNFGDDDPCDNFKKIKFPVNEFFPKSQC